MKTKNTLLYFALAITAAGALFFLTKSTRLQQQLTESEVKQTELTEKVSEYEQLTEIDSMLLSGDYDTAIRSYTASMQTREENKMGIPLRIALAEKLLHDQMGAVSSKSHLESRMDSLSQQKSATPKEVRKYDSLNFTLEKTKVQLARLKRQMNTKSFGEYLKFKSKKGNQLHYIGQVKNGKANGYGIALLDTGSRYEGQWQDNQRQGEGTFYWPDGEYYVGDYENDKRSGFGTYYWPNGEKYAGEWKEDKRSGSGQFFGTDGDIIAGGEWNDDKLVEVNKR
ncbi:MORN repeat-containing protein [Maribacter sp. 2307UL18-2]|uniref:MORN repeat-containing protein n=1 Tax=Maribacter sp. 2307UL18-2 TaxID=3386274 RepID=UPI0039BD57FC